MRRTREDERARDRILDDTELRQVWLAAEADNEDPFGALVRILLLTAQRRGAVIGMKWSHIDGSGTWAIDTAARMKGTATTVRLPEAALAIIRAQPKFAGNPIPSLT
jgi:integrase